MTMSCAAAPKACAAVQNIVSGMVTAAGCQRITCNTTRQATVSAEPAEHQPAGPNKALCLSQRRPLQRQPAAGVHAELCLPAIHVLLHDVAPHPRPRCQLNLACLPCKSCMLALLSPGSIQIRAFLSPAAVSQLLYVT